MNVKIRRTLMLPMLKIRNISTIDNNVDYCVQLVKTHDYENFLVGLMIARKHRASFYTIKAFNIEIAMIKDQSKGNSNTGRLRFKWWQDVIEEIYNSNSEPKNPVGAAMATMVRDKGITRRWFQNVIEARQKDLYVAQPSTLSELEDYCERSHSSLLYMLLESMQINDENTEYMASHVGVGYGLTVLLRGTIHHLANGYIYYPVDSMTKFGLRPNFYKNITSLDETDAKAFKEVTYDIASQAFGHLESARKLQDLCLQNADVRSCMLPSIVTSLYLEQLRNVDFNPIHPTLLEQQTRIRTLLLQLLKSRFITHRI